MYTHTEGVEGDEDRETGKTDSREETERNQSIYISIHTKEKEKKIGHRNCCHLIRNSAV